MKRIFSNKWFWIGVAALVVVGLVLLFFFARELVVPTLVAVLLIGLLWVGAEVGLRAWKKRKRKAFDEGLTAKEGIEDRKREWEGFQSELEKQKIDRYELPFYLLVGEPQSGKSVLLQNSDLHFPFGQNKLSGIGGTRGCDWWFTEEAVILDLAGRLFTHEGGVADQLEWEAFLDLLANFRPICPANGILLVVPCDSLLTDSADVARQKANKIQAALLTLAKKLDAQLPIYLVLTKADKLFGFAESVHRLDAQKRHEMFGWSRGAEKVDALFDLEEARGGFRELVARARLLRAEMLSQARIPEAIGEVDRMFAFPDELAALEEPLEIYLRRVFTDSGLSDRLSFRGIYLTSGLQSGVPIARVCAQALGGAGDADMQELEALFTKQRAYFIKDLVRTRVFGERGIVRPTKGRVIAAQRRAAIGYGASAVIALISLIGSMVYLFSAGEARVDELTKQALAMAKSAERARDWSLPEHLKVLEAVHAALVQERSTTEEIWNSTREELRNLYAAVFDGRLAPALRKSLQEHLVQLLDGPGPASLPRLEEAAACAGLLVSEVDFASGSALEVAENILPLGEREYLPQGREEPFTLAQAIEIRRECPGDAKSAAPAGSATAIDALAERVLDLYEDCLTPGRPYQPGAELGYLLAADGIMKAHKALVAKTVADDRAILTLMERYSNSWTQLEKCADKLEAKSPMTKEIKFAHVWIQLDALDTTRKQLADLLAARASIQRQRGDWRAMVDLKVFIDGEFVQNEDNIDYSSFLNPDDFKNAFRTKALSRLDREIVVPSTMLKERLDETLRAVALAAPNADWKLEKLGADIESGMLNLVGSEAARNAYVAKVREIGRRFAERYKDWDDLAGELKALGLEVVEHEFLGEPAGWLVHARTALVALDKDRTKEFVLAIEKLLLQHLSKLERNWVALRTGEVPGVTPDLKLEVLDRLAGIKGDVAVGAKSLLAQSAQGLMDRYVQARQDLMLAFWKSLPPEGDSTVAMVHAFNDHMAVMKERFGTSGGDGLDATWLEDVQSVLIDRLDRHRRDAEKHWTPTPVNGQAGVTLIDAALLVGRDLERSEVEDLLNRAAEEVKGPNFDDSLMSRNSAVFEKLEKAREPLDALRALRTPKNAMDVTNHPYVRWLRLLADGLVKNPTLNEDGAKLAAKVFEIDLSKQGATNVPDNAGGYYARCLYDSLRLRMIEEVRARYRTDLEKLLDTFTTAIDALYASDFDAAKRMDDTAVMQDLGGLLDRNGRFDKLRASYRASDDTIGLFPKDAAALEADPVWAAQQFLSELQVFFLGKEGRRVQDGTITLKLRPLIEASSIWDDSVGRGRWKEAFYSPVNAQGGWEYVGVSRSMPEKNLEWNFRPDATKRMRMRWNDSPNNARDFQEGDVRLEIVGSLAPLLFTWSGDRQEDGSWRVLVRPTGSQLPAPFEVRFLERELPVRPKRPG